MCVVCERFPDPSKLDEDGLKMMLASVGEEMKKLPHKGKYAGARTHLEKLIGTALGIEDKDRDLAAEKCYEERRRG